MPRSGPTSPGSPPARSRPPVEGWSFRAPILCDALAWAQGAAATPIQAAPEIRAREDAATAACRAVLLPLSAATRPGSPAGRW